MAKSNSKVATFVRFECGQEDRIGKVLGPFEYAQITYDTLRVCDPGKDDDTAIANIDGADGRWLYDGKYWSDVVIFGDMVDNP